MLWAATGGGRGWGRLCSGRVGGLHLGPHRLVYSLLFFLLPVGRSVVFDVGRRRGRRGRVGAVNGVAGLPVGAMQGQGEGDSAVAKLTWTDAGRPERRRERKRRDKGEEMEKSPRNGDGGGKQKQDPFLRKLK